MVIFLAGSVPLMFAIAVLGYAKHSSSLTDLGQHVARGFFAFIVSFIVYLLLRPIVQLNYTSSGIYGYYLAHHNLYYLSWCVISYLIFYKIPHTDTPEIEITPVLAYFAAFYALLAVSDILLNVKEITSYILFLLPISRIGVILISVAAIIFARRMYIIIRYGLLLIPFATSAVAAFVPLLHTLRYITASVFLAVSLLVVGCLLYFLADRR